MNYKMHVENNINDESYDISTLIYNVEHTTSLQGQAGKLTFSIKKDPNEILKISCGNTILFWNDDIPIFYGHVFKIKTDKSGDFSITAYDNTRYLQNHDYLLVDDMNLQDVFNKICNNLKLKNKLLGKARFPQQKINKKHFADTSYFDMIQYAINETNNTYVTEKVIRDDGSFEDVYDPNMSIDKIPVYFFIRDNFGTLELNDLESNIKYRRTGIDGSLTRAWTGNEWYYYDESLKPELEPLIIGEESLLIDYDYELSIDDNTFNEIYVMETTSDSKSKKNNNKDVITSDGKKLAFAKQDENSVKKYGLLRRIENVKNVMNESQLEAYANILLENYSMPSRTMKIEALGYNGVNAGDGFLLKLNKLGVEGMVYVLSATHHYGADIHTMSLEVSTAKNMKEVL